ncbi:MAG TPA: dihydrofolate reductase [Candidatus Barnesiella excrementipullorum]|uniref:Dihydrofolate reductase n=1 Tax=Candidatus Barnesiella excrementipullorum TaxID=2838479 RepID=A0A9D1VRL1_9BACT|nr:dihydrofolate reductase [Candidatus Barnesiella excrementipullorum]
MPTLSLIAAIAADGGIGKGQQLLCHLPNDLKHFKTLTMGHTIVMGRNTYESLPKGALPGRTNVVVTHNPAARWENVRTETDIESALSADGKEEEIFIIGGATLYEQTIARADKLYITHIYHTFPEADRFFPAIDTRVWQETAREEMTADERHPYNYAFVTYERR